MPRRDSQVQRHRLEDIRRLLTYRHQLGAGVDENGLDPDIRDAAELTRKLVELAELFPRLDTLRWGCTFAREDTIGCSQRHRLLTLLTTLCNSSAPGSSATCGVKNRSPKELHLPCVAR
jgi:hypothetical protein